MSRERDNFRRFSYNIEIKVSVDGVDIPHIAECQIHLGLKNQANKLIHEKQSIK